MKPRDTAQRYDRLACWWRDQHAKSDYGIQQLKRAISFTQKKGHALDVGCGSSGRFIQTMMDHGFTVEGLDVSKEMLRYAEEIHPACTYYLTDISSWKAPHTYDLIAAWDSTFHLPLNLQEPALTNMCHALAPKGVLIFTCGASENPEEISGSFEGEEFDYSTLGPVRYNELLNDLGCVCRHLEYDQGPDGKHVCIIAQKQ